MTPSTKTSVLIIGSGPQAPQAREWDRGAFTHVVAINNAWRIRPDWSHAIFPEDFPEQNRPRVAEGQIAIMANDYVPVQNRYGGFVYAGGTMAFTAGYWALGALKPDVMAFIGCDMVYPATGSTHFYGTGTADPLRQDPSLQSLEAKSARLEVLAAKDGCACINLSDGESRLVFARGEVGHLPDNPVLQLDQSAIAEVEERERALGYYVPSGRYWKEAERFDLAALRGLDAAWLAVHGTEGAAGG